MSLELELPEVMELRPRITVVGVGGAGGNAINNMIASGLDGVDFVVANTDAQAIALSSAEQRIQLGRHLTEGLGAGSKPEIGEAAAEEAIDEIKSMLDGSHMVFVAAGMGGGTGTGAAAVVARAARELGILTVGVVTKPFQFEGARRMRIAEQGINEIRQHVDTLIVIPNQNLFRVANEKTTFAEAFVLADQVLHAGVACITDLIVREGLINLDFADVNTVMSNMGTAMMGTGEASGERRAVEAAEEAIANPLLSELSMKGAKGLLVSITGGEDMTLYEVDEAASRVREEVDPEANIIVGATFDKSLTNKLRVSIVASGITPKAVQAPVRQVAAKPATAPAQVRPQPQAARGSQPQAKKTPPPAPRQSTTQRPAPTPSGPGRLVEKLGAAQTPSQPQRQAEPRTLALEHSDEVRPVQTWSGPGNVLIEKAVPTLASTPPMGAGTTQPAPTAPFVPRPPAAIERSASAHRGAKAVELSDFDPHAQKVYAAGSDGHEAPMMADDQPKQGFFARLRGKKNRQNESVERIGADFDETPASAGQKNGQNFASNVPVAKMPNGMMPNGYDRDGGKAIDEPGDDFPEILRKKSG